MQEVYHEAMPTLGKLLCCFGVHLVSQQQQLILEMLNRRFQRSAMFTAERKGSGNPDRADGIETIRILDDLPFHAFRVFSSVLTKRDSVYCFADTINFIWLNIVQRQKRSCIGIILCTKQFMIVCIVKQGAQRHRFQITIWFVFCNQHRVVVYTQGMLGIMPAGIVAKQRIHIVNRFVK